MGGVPGLKKNGYDEQRYQERYETPGPEGDGIPEGEFPGALLLSPQVSLSTPPVMHSR